MGQGMTGISGFFRLTEDGAFDGTDAARGPWSADHCHAGPVAGLAARAVEQVVGSDKALVRLTLDLMRPVPMTGLKVEAEIMRAGRNTAAAQVRIVDGNGKPCVAGTSLHLSRADFDTLPTAPVCPVSLSEAEPQPNFLVPLKDGLPTFGHHVEVKLPKDQKRGLGPKIAWMRAPPIVVGETPSPFQALCPLADCGNGISANATLHDYTFLNPDLTIVMHREPESDWLASDAVSHWQSTGIGMAQAVISDTIGPVATALQTLLIRPR